MGRDLSDLVAPGNPQLLAPGFQFTEGPVWHPDGYLLFSDIPGDTIYRWAPGGSAEPHIQPSRQSNGLTYDAQGRLIACEHAGRRVSRQSPGGAMETVIDSYEGKRLNSPNDVVVHSSGAIYFTDPPYGILPDLGELGFNGVYRIGPDGSLTLLLSDFERPNGLAFSPQRVGAVHRRHRPAARSRLRRRGRRVAIQRPRVRRHERGSPGQPRRDEGGRGGQPVHHRRGRSVGRRARRPTRRHSRLPRATGKRGFRRPRQPHHLRHRPDVNLQRPGQGPRGEGPLNQRDPT